MGRAIGIDLGTTNSCAAVVEGGEPRVLRSRLGYTTLPSIVAFDEEGRPLVGQPAERRMILSPQETIYGSKRLLGRTFLRGVTERFQPHFQYRLVADEDGFVAAHVAGKIVPLVDVAALILREIRAAAEQGMGEPAERAVVTVPAYFNENQRAVVREAGRRADLDVIRIINEPTAAALCFGFNRGEKKRLLVFDLGGGTFDVSIVELDGNVFGVVATDGDTFLGGLDFDRRLVESLVERLAKRLGRPIDLDPISWQRLRIAAQEAKHQMSAQEKALIHTPGMTLVDGTKLDVTGSVTRLEFEEICRDLVGRTVAIVKRALETAQLGMSDIDDVLLVGGQTRMPLIHRSLRELFGKEPTKRIHADEVVALGAAIAADSHDRFDSAVLVDVVPMPIGIAEAGGRFRSVIGRNTPVPHKATTTVQLAPGRSTVKVAVFQGDKARAVDNEYLGTLVLDNLPLGEAPRNCELLFHLDSECLLKVRATVEGTGIDREVILGTQQTPDEVLEELGSERIRAVTPAHTPIIAEHATARPGRTASMPAVAANKLAKAAPAPGTFDRLFGWLRRK